jgi:hypothetical protein
LATIGSGATVHQCVLQTVARLGVTAIAPEQASQLVARVGHAGLQSEDREQRPILVARQIDVFAARKPKPELPQQVEFCEQVPIRATEAAPLHGQMHHFASVATISR